MAPLFFSVSLHTLQILVSMCPKRWQSDWRSISTYFPTSRVLLGCSLHEISHPSCSLSFTFKSYSSSVSQFREGSHLLCWMINEHPWHSKGGLWSPHHHLFDHGWNSRNSALHAEKKVVNTQAAMQNDKLEWNRGGKICTETKATKYVKSCFFHNIYICYHIIYII